MIISEKPTAIFKVNSLSGDAAYEEKTQNMLSDRWVPSRFNVAVDVSENRKAVYNTFTTAITILNQEKWRKYLNAGSEYGASLEPIPDFLKILHAKGFLVSKDVDELAFVRQNHLASRNSEELLCLNVLTTLNCNLRCPYCFEGKVQVTGTGKTMTAEINDAAVRHLSRLAKGKKEVRLNWFGGEPLMDIRSITNMSAQLIPALDRDGIKYGAIITTNGTLLNNTIVDQLYDCKVLLAQVTVDVPKASKRDMSGKETMEKVLDNICIAAEKLGVYIRVNLTSDNEAEFDQLYDGIVRRGLHKRLKSINIAHVFMPECGRGGCDVSGFPFQNYIEIERRECAKAKALGIPMNIFLPMNTLTSCTALIGSSAVIGPDGLLYKCVKDAGMVERAYGSVLDEKEKPGKLALWSQYDGFGYEMCKDCRVLPQCAGGCAHKRLFQSGSLQNEDFCYWHIRGNLEERIREVVAEKMSEKAHNA